MSAQATTDVVRDSEEKFIQNYMDTCRHFTGIQHGTCQRSVAYKDVRSGKTTSCFNATHGFSPNTMCMHRGFPNREEAVEYLRKCNEDTQKVLKGICPDCDTKLIDNTIKEGEHAGHGSLICPNCKAVKVWI